MTLPLESIETLVVRLPTREDFRWNGLEQPLGEVFVVRLRSGEHVGYGETVPLPDWGGPHGTPAGETPAIGEVVVHDLLAPLLLGMDATRIPDVRARIAERVLGYPYAVGALEIALHDLVGRASGVPVHTLLGGRRRDAVPIAHMIGLMPAARALEEADAAIAEGCRAFQVKGGQNVERDVELIRALRERGGSELWLRVDANCGYGGWKSGLNAVRALAEAGADMVEQPVGDAGALARVTAEAPIPVMADEACWSPRDALALASAGAVDALSIYIGKAGGLGPAAAIAAIAAASDLPHDLNGSLEGAIGNAANLQLAVASPAELLPCVIPINGPAHDAPTSVFGRYFVDDVNAAGMLVRDGHVVVGDEPGLGIDVDEERLERATVRRRASGAVAGPPA